MLGQGSPIASLLAALVTLVPPGEVHVLALFARPVTRPSDKDIYISPWI